jgi:acyl-[acyl-carrier-protein]-phospholipid O-acyltransferase/long-chain-fatty-acid--[acyl-carrier-protein] ligase
MLLRDMATHSTAGWLHLAFFRSARRHWRQLAIADSTGRSLTYGRALLASLALGRLLARRTPGQRMVGILLPATVGGALANIALFMAGRLPVNLNFTIGAEALAAAIELAGIRTIVTSRVFLEKAGLPAEPSMIFLEDLIGAITIGDKIAAFIDARLVSQSRFAARHGAGGDAAGALATIIFSSGSTGMPKGVMLTHANILENIDSFSSVYPMSTADRFLGVLPFFHSFGFTCTLWFPLLQGSAVVFHPNPMDAKTVGELAAEHGATMLVAAPTFCANYVRRCTPDQFKTLRTAIVGAEKLREPLRSEFRDRFGIPLFEGYGMTEMSPVVAVNRPDVTDGGVRTIGDKPGSVGRPIPGVSARIADPDTGQLLPTDAEGVLLLKGPNMMAGYLNDPARTADVIRGGWYVTGDIAKIDADGFIFITDRLSRFSKIGGEMVPHMRIEDAINAALGEVASAVAAVPDAARGERLIAFYTRGDLGPDELWNRLLESDLPRLWIPKRENIHLVDALPTLANGKTDLRRVKALALERANR